MKHIRISKISALFAFLLLIQGCVQETAGDTTRRELDRQKAAADQIEAEYSQIKGMFTGSYGASDILLTLDVDRQSGQGLVPEPTLVGTLVFTPRVLTDGSDRILSITYPISSGQYDGSSDLSLIINQNGSPTTVHCKVANQTNLACDWYSSVQSRFTLQKAAGQALETASGSFGGTYVGSNDDYPQIKAFFRTFLTPQSGSSSVPQISIVGSFTFYASPSRSVGDSRATFAKFPFTDGAYDPRTSTLAIRMSGDSPIAINCVVKTSTDLHCTWIGNHGERWYEEFDLKKST